MLSNYNLHDYDLYRVLDYIKNSEISFFLIGERFFCDDKQKDTAWEFLAPEFCRPQIAEALQSKMMSNYGEYIGFHDIKIWFIPDLGKYARACILLKKQFIKVKNNLYSLDEDARKTLIKSTVETLE